MFQVTNRPVKFSTRKKPFERGDTITYEDFCKEVPEPQRCDRAIKSLLDMRKIIEVEETVELTEKGEEVLDSIEEDSLESLSYQELQAEAKERGEKYIGVKKKDLIKVLE